MREKIKNIIEAASFAPSSHNTQPWKFRIAENSIKLYADFSRKLKESDSTSRMIYIAQGAALMNMRIAADKYGFSTHIKYNSGLYSAQPQFIAEIFLEPSLKRIYTDELFFAIARRVSNRNKYLDKKIPQIALDTMQSTLQDTEIKIVFVNDNEQRQKIALAMGAGMKEKMHKRAFRCELARWLRTNISCKRDGMPGYTHNMSLAKSILAPFVLRIVDVSSVEKKKALKRVNNYAVLGIIGTLNDNALEWVKTGEALQHALLYISSKNMAASIMAAIIESNNAREELTRVLGWKGKILPQIFFGFGYTLKQAPHSPRRPTIELMI